MQDLNEKHAVITCDSQGLGLAMVEALASCGGNVTAIGRIVDWPEYGGPFERVLAAQTKSDEGTLRSFQIIGIFSARPIRFN